MGYELTSDLFNADYMRSLHVMAIDNFEYSGKGANWRFEGRTLPFLTYSINEIQQGLGWLRFPTIDDDPSGMYNEEIISGSFAQGLFYNLQAIPSDYKARFTGSISSTAAAAVSFSIEAVLTQGNLVLDRKTEIQIPSGGTLSVDFELEFNLDAGQSIGFFINGITPNNITADVNFNSDFRLNFEPSSNRLYRDDVISIQELLSDRISFEKFLEAVVQLFQLKFVTDNALRSVTLYQSNDDDRDIYGDTVEGFLDGSIVDLTDFVVAGSINMQVIEGNTARLYNMLFKESSDAFIEDRKLEDDDQGIRLYSSLQDLGSGESLEPEDIENDLFEPLANTNFNGLSIPVLWDNTQGIRTKKYGFRIATALGFVQQALSNDSTPESPVYWRFESQQRSTIPYIGQAPQRKYFDFSDSTWKLPTRSVVFSGQVAGESLIDVFYGQYFLDKEFSKRYEYIYQANVQRWAALTPRATYRLVYDGETAVYRLVSKRDWRPGGTLGVLIQLQPIVNLFPSK